MTGKIKHYDDNRGFGFIVPDDKTEDIFFHVSQANYKGITKGQRISYDVKQGKKGLEGHKIKLADDQESQ